MKRPAITVKCPTCHRSVEWLEMNTYRPFCSERCKLIDLGEWAAEEKVIPGESVSTDLDESNESFFQ